MNNPLLRMSDVKLKFFFRIFNFIKVLNLLIYYYIYIMSKFIMYKIIYL